MSKSFDYDIASFLHTLSSDYRESLLNYTFQIYSPQHRLMKFIAEKY